MKPYLTTSAKPARSLVARKRRERIQIADHRGRRVEGADQVLPLGGVDAGLASDGGIHHPEQRRRDLDELHAAQPRGRHESGEVGDGASAEADDGVRPGEVGLAHDPPQERRHLDALGRLRIRDLGEQHLVPVEQRLAQCGGRGAQRGRVHDEHLGHTGAEVGCEIEPQAAPDQDGVGLRSRDEDLGGGVGHACPSVPAPADSAPATQAAISATMVSIGRDDVSAV